MRGFILGFSIAAPVGPIGTLCIRRSLRDGWFSGLVSGLGAATADMLYGSVAAFGLNTISNILISGEIWLRGFGGTFLVYLGLRTIVSRPKTDPEREFKARDLGNYASTFILTLTNPLTLLTFVAIFTSVTPASSSPTALQALHIVAGVFLGSSTWWAILSLTVAAFRERLNDKFKRRIESVSGGIIVIFGLAALLSLLQIQ